MTHTDDTNYQDPTDTTIKIDVATRYLEDDSDPEDDKFVFAYTITITNQGDTAAKLLTRHWVLHTEMAKPRKSKAREWLVSSH